MNLRQLARDKPCMVRLPGCTGGGESSVLAHYRLAGLCGTGLKPSDVIGAHACHMCHDAIDQRRKIEGYTRDMLRLAHAEGVMRTLAELERLGFTLTRGK